MSNSKGDLCLWQFNKKKSPVVSNNSVYDNAILLKRHSLFILSDRLILQPISYISNDLTIAQKPRKAITSFKCNSRAKNKIKIQQFEIHIETTFILELNGCQMEGNELLSNIGHTYMFHSAGYVCAVCVILMISRAMHYYYTGISFQRLPYSINELRVCEKCWTSRIDSSGRFVRGGNNDGFQYCFLLTTYYIIPFTTIIFLVLFTNVSY